LKTGTFGRIPVSSDFWNIIWSAHLPGSDFDLVVTTIFLISIFTKRHLWIKKRVPITVENKKTVERKNNFPAGSDQLAFRPTAISDLRQLFNFVLFEG